MKKLPPSWSIHGVFCDENGDIIGRGLVERPFGSEDLRVTFQPYNATELEEARAVQQQMVRAYEEETVDA